MISNVMTFDLPIKIRIVPRLLHFKKPAGTSRGVYLKRRVWYVVITSPTNKSLYGLGECAPLYDLSSEYDDQFEAKLHLFAKKIEIERKIDVFSLQRYPSILFAFECAFLSGFSTLKGESHLCLFDTPFSRGEVGIPINGLVWMGNYAEMYQRMKQKLREGFHCIKIKIGAIDFQEELNLLKLLRRDFTKNEVELRVDANGCFMPSEAMDKLNRLAEYEIHSIEQPIKAGQWEFLSSLCRKSPIPIALDEELIGITERGKKEELLDTVKPHFLVLKPTLHGGLWGTEEWMTLAAKRKIPYWITSALESNVGLNAVAQWTSYATQRIWMQNVPGNAEDVIHLLPQIHGLGTGQLFNKNYNETSLTIKSGVLWDNRVKQAVFEEDVKRFKAEWEDNSSYMSAHTSGSTGIPKLIRIKKAYMKVSAQKTCEFLGLQAGDSALLCMPLKYIAGKMMVVRSMVSKLRLIAVSPDGHPFARLQYSPVFVAMTPYQVIQTLKSEDETKLLKGVKHLIIGGGGISAELAKKLENFPNNVWSTYGMTETLSHIAMRRINGVNRSQQYIVFPGVSISIDNDDCLIIDAPDIGVCHIKTNDIVRILEDKQKFIVLGRRDNVICSGGIKLQIEQIEERLYSAPCPLCITAVPDKELGEALTLIYQADESIEPILRDICRKKLSRYEFPKHFVPVKKMPMTETNKPLRAEIKRIAALIVEKNNLSRNISI